MARNVCKTAAVMTGTQLRAFREGKAMTQNQLAEALGMKPVEGGKLVSSWESGNRVPRLREAELWRLFFPDRESDPLTTYTDGLLFAQIHGRLAEILARLAVLQARSEQQRPGGDEDAEEDLDQPADDPGANSDESSTIPNSGGETAAPHRKAATGWGTEGGTTLT